jgi:hypothetical protein
MRLQTDKELQEYCYEKAMVILEEGKLNDSGFLSLASTIADAMFLEHQRGHLCNECESYAPYPPVHPPTIVSVFSSGYGTTTAYAPGTVGCDE